MGDSGITAIELMVTLAISALLATVAWPNYRSWQERDALERDVMVVKAVLTSMRSQSIQEGLPRGEVGAPANSGITCTSLYYGARFRPGKDQVELTYFCDQDGDRDLDADEVTVLGVRDLSSPTTVATSTTADLIVFNKGGALFTSGSSGQGSVCLQAGDKRHKIVVSSSGRISEESSC